MKQIKLTKGKIAIVNNQDFKWLNKFKWYASVSRGYFRAARKLDGKKIYMSREIANKYEDICGFIIDHINHNTLDNRRRNLRLVTKSQNLANSKIIRKNRSIHKGLTWKKGHWEVRIQVGGKMYYPGCTKDIKEAIKIYNTAAKKYFGNYAFNGGQI